MARRRKNKKRISTIIFVVLLIIAGVMVYFVWDGYFRDKGDGNIDDSSQVSDESVVGVVNKSGEEDNNIESDEEVMVEKKVIQYEGESPNELEILTGDVSYIGVSDGKITIRTSIYQYLETGTCELVMIQSDMTVYTEIVEIMNDATTSTCMGFDVPTTNLLGGDLQFVIYLSSGDRTGEISGGVSI